MKIPQHILKKDKILANVVSSTILPSIEKQDTVFEALISSIISQQLSVKAAATIHQRFRALFSESVSPKRVHNMSLQTMRDVGLSKQKSTYVHNIAEYFSAKENAQYDWYQADSDTIINKLTPIKGVGVWTVQMLLIFQLEKQDVFPVGDLGIQQKMKALYNLEGEKKEILQNMQVIATKWSPFRSIASRYMWQFDLKKGT